MYASELAAAEVSGDWMKAFELMTEANVLKVSLPHASTEVAIRTMASGKGRCMEGTGVGPGHIISYDTTQLNPHISQKHFFWPCSEHLAHHSRWKLCG